MSRTKRSAPTSGCFMRYPRHKRALRTREATTTELRDEGITIHANRNPEPPTAWDDLIVSEIRGQAWARKH